MKVNQPGAQYSCVK